MADKGAAFERLRSIGAPTPTTLEVTNRNCGEINAFLKFHESIDYWYLRFDEARLRTLPRVACSNELIGIASCLDLPEDLVVFVQERVKARSSGVLAVREDMIYLEHVVGELEPLLRSGVSPTRTLLSPTGVTIRSEQNLQEFIGRWEETAYKHVRVPQEPAPLSRRVVGQCVELGRRVAGNAVLEWIERTDGSTVFLDYRPMPSGFLCGQQEFATFFDSGEYWSLPQHVIASRGQATLNLVRPLYEYVGSVLPLRIPMRFDSGGILAHLCVYAAVAGIPCRIKARGLPSEGR